MYDQLTNEQKDILSRKLYGGYWKYVALNKLINGNGHNTPEWEVASDLWQNYEDLGRVYR